MTEGRRENHHHEGPVQTILKVAGLVPWSYDKNNKRVGQDNLQDKLPQLEQEIANKPWVLRLLDQVHNGEKNGIFTISPGRIIITVALATTLGVEFGFRGGRDLKELRDSVKHLYKKENPSGPKK
ncbi:MAG: hypothetical protein Q8O68_01315 [Candidatus Daviesbacteria bacterium]|nr:hypothetical protein [Candidatus Daviesbacteria bacterium]